MSNIYIQEPPTNGKVALKTSVGDIDIELWSKEAPKACRNFVQLCLEGYYDNVAFHRVVKDFIVQGGDPTETGEGGESIYGQPFKDEFHSRLRFVRRGLVAMANAGANDNGSQFFFTMGPTPELQNKHTIFGKVVGDTLYNMLRLQEVEIGADERPIEPHRILSTEVLANPFDDIIPRQIKRQKKEKDDEKKIKSKSKATKNFSLLSFGEEAEEDEEQVDRATESFRGKSKSSHDLTNDPRLSSIPAVEEEEKKKKGEGSTEDAHKTKPSPSVEEIKAKLEAEAAEKRKTKAEPPAEDAKKVEEAKMGPPEVKKERKSRFSDITDEDRKNTEAEEKKKSRFSDTSDEDKKKKDAEDEKKKKTDEDSSRKKAKTEEKDDEKKKRDSESDEKRKKKSDDRDDDKRKRRSDDHDDDRKRNRSDDRDDDKRRSRSDDHDDKRRRRSHEREDDRKKRRREEEESDRRKRKGDSREDDSHKRKREEEEKEKDDGRKKVKTEPVEKSPKGGDEKKSSSEDVRKKSKKEQEDSPRTKEKDKDSKPAVESVEDSKKSKMDELKKEARKLQKDIRDSKKRIEAESQAREAKAKAEEEAGDKKESEEGDPAEEGDLLTQVKKERQKYKMRKKMMGKKENREAATLALLEKFQSKLAAARTLAGDYDEEEEEEKEAQEEEDPNDMSWMRHKLHFQEEGQKKKVIDANVADSDRYDINDPRNPLTQRRRESSKKAMKDKR